MNHWRIDVGHFSTFVGFLNPSPARLQQLAIAVVEIDSSTGLLLASTGRAKLSQGGRAPGPYFLANPGPTLARPIPALALSTPSPPAIPLSPFPFNRFPPHSLCRSFLPIRYSSLESNPTQRAYSIAVGIKFRVTADKFSVLKNSALKFLKTADLLENPAP